jgi:hypothetical protein
VVPQNQAVITTLLPVMTCPSRGSPPTVYSFTLSGVPGLPTLSWRAAPSDYGVQSGVLGVFWNVHVNQPGSREGALSVNKRVTMGEILDGTSNVVLLAEIAGRNAVFARTRGMVAASGNQGAGWGDPINGENWVAGSLYDGSGPTGPCVINCTNLSGRGIWSFHPRGCNMVRCDASVQFLDQQMSNAAYALMVTRADRNPIPD